MKSLNSITELLDNGGDLNYIRCAIADLVMHHLHCSKESNNNHALAHFINAVGSLTLNVHSTRQPTTVGLYTALRDLEKAISETDGTEEHTLRSKHAERLTHDLLIEAVRVIREKVSSMSSQTSSVEQVTRWG